MKNTFNKISKCRVCKSHDLIDVINLGKQYIQGSFEKKKLSSELKNKIPMKLVLCKNCSLLQARYSVNPNTLYKDYWYSSGINYTMRSHLFSLYKEIRSCKEFKKFKDINILDIGCNDGTFLNFFSKKFKKVGIDPSQISNKIRNKNIKIFNDFFPSTKLSLLKKKYEFITSIAMFYDLEDPIKFVKCVKKILSNKGVWIFELSYLPDMLKLNSYDTICHEHLEYYSLTSLKYITDKCKMKIFKIKFNDINGGSIRCYVTHTNNKSFDSIDNLEFLNKFLKKENKMKINTTKPYIDFYKRILKMRTNLTRILKNLVKNGNTIHIYGASTKGNTILQWNNIDKKIIKFAADRNPQKWGARTIGSKIEIISEKLSKKKKPGYYLVLPWHFKKEFLKREKNFLNQGGKMIFPLPKIKIY